MNISLKRKDLERCTFDTVYEKFLCPSDSHYASYFPIEYLIYVRGFYNCCESSFFEKRYRKVEALFCVRVSREDYYKYQIGDKFVFDSPYECFFLDSKCL